MTERELSFFQAAKITKVINNQLADARGDLALELYELEESLKAAFKPHEKQKLKLLREMQDYRKSLKGANGSRQKLNEKISQVDDELLDINRKTKKIEVQKFDYGTGGPRDLKPHLNLEGLKAFMPLLNMASDNDTEETKSNQKAQENG